jgi:hypothetical protein
MAHCFCCKLDGACECGTEACWECGACPAHCECSCFFRCECVRIDVDLDDARLCPVHGGDHSTNV